MIEKSNVTGLKRPMTRSSQKFGIILHLTVSDCVLVVYLSLYQRVWVDGNESDIIFFLVEEFFSLMKFMIKKIKKSSGGEEVSPFLNLLFT